MIPLLRGLPHCVRRMLSAALLISSGFAQDPAPAADPANADATALLLARRYLEGGEDSRAALLEALELMGWGVRNAKGDVVKAPPPAGNTGLAMRDYELEELLWKPIEQPSVRLISFAQALAVPFEDVDAEELAQDLVDSIRKSADSAQPQQRFWARFIVALGRVSPANYDLLKAAPASIIQPSEARMKELQEKGVSDPIELFKAMAPTPVWAADDPVLAPSPRPKRSSDRPRADTTERDQARMEEISDELGKVSNALSGSDPGKRAAAEERMNKLMAEMNAISQRMQAAAMQQMASAMQAAGSSDESAGSRFLAEWRDEPVSFLQIALITRVLAADIRAGRTRGTPRPAAWPSRVRSFTPLATLTLAQVSGPSPDAGFSGAAGDIWAGGWGAYTEAVIEHHLPDSTFNRRVAIANTMIAWFKTIMSVARQNITVEVDNAPLVRTKTRSPGERRTARATVKIDFPNSDVLKAIRAAANVTSVDLDLPEGGPVSGAKVVWRLPEGSYNTKYAKADGGWMYNPSLAVVQFAAAGSSAAYISKTNDAGVATITIEGVPQRKTLSPHVRPYPRRAVVAVEVTMKVGNLTQDLTDAISIAMGGPVSGGLEFVADMILRTSFFFQAGKVFEVTDWKEPAWEGTFRISVKGSGSKKEKGEKGAPDAEYAWRMDRFMEGRLRTPEWEEEEEIAKGDDTYGRHLLEVDADPRYFRLNDFSMAKTVAIENRYEATGPIQIQPPARNQLELFSRAEPSGSAELLFTGPMMQLELKPFFGAECLVSRSERNRGRSFRKAGTEFLSLLNGVSPETFTVIEENDGKSGMIEGTKTIEGRGTLPYVPTFDVEITLKYRLWRNEAPPKNR